MTATDIMAEQPAEGTVAAVLAMLDFTNSKGLLASNTANGMKTGVAQVAGIEGEGWQDLDVREIDEDELFRRFRTLKMNQFSDGTKNAYTNRFHQARAMYLARLADEPDWVAAGRRSPLPGSGEPRAPRKRTPPARQAAPSPVEQPAAARTGGSAPLPDSMVRNTYYLADDTYAEFLLPRRLTIEDAEYLAGILTAQARRNTRPASDGTS